MPFEPLTPEEKKEYRPSCSDPQHDPPTMIVITEPVAWVCPSCGARVILLPPDVRWTVPACGTPIRQPDGPRWLSVPEPVEMIHEE